jgi:glycosyltransferase involved in cell wall biosynthesis
MTQEQPKPFIVACIPALNEEKTIKIIIKQTLKHVDEVIVCDDGSTDQTPQIVELSKAVLLTHEKNLGKGKALQTCFQYLRQKKPDIIITLDGDGQHDPEDIPKLIKPITDNEADLVIGSRYVEGAETDAPTYRRLGLGVINEFGKSANEGVRDSQSGFRAFNNTALKIFSDSKEEGFGVETEQLSAATKYNLRVKEVPTNIRYSGLENTSKKNPVLQGIELVMTGLKIMVQDKPLLLIGGPGLLLFLTSLITGRLLVHYYTVEVYFSVPLAVLTFGFLTMGILLIISSLILYSLSLITTEIRKLRYQEE